MMQFTMRNVKRLLRPIVYRTLSPKVVRFLRFGGWYIFSYLPHLLSSKFVTRTPEVRSFGKVPVGVSLARQLDKVKLSSPTRMCHVMTWFGSDKARSHGYTPLYSALFMERFKEPIRILELGLGSNNPDVLSNMGIFGAPGASLRGWRELFPHALVFGADIDRRILFEEDRIKTYYCDQLDRSSIHELWSHPGLQAGMDIIIEDGLHTFEANICFLEESLDHLRPWGTYIIEDIVWDTLDNWCDRLETVYSKQYPTYEFALVILASHGYNNMLVARRAAD